MLKVSRCMVKKFLFLFFCQIYIMGGKSSNQRARFLRCLSNDNVRMSGGSVFETFLINKLKQINRKCDRNSKISDKLRKLGIFREKIWVASRKKIEVFKIIKGGKFAVGCVAND